MIPDFFRLARPPRIRRSVIIDLAGSAVELELQALNLVEKYGVEQQAELMAAKYVGTEAVDFPPVGGEAVVLNEHLCHLCATLAVAVVTPVVTFEQLVAMAFTCPAGFERLVTVASELENESGKGGAESIPLLSV